MSQGFDWPNVRSIFNRTIGIQYDTPISVCAPGLRYGPLPIKRDISDRRSKLDCFIARYLTNIERHQYAEAKSTDWLSEISRVVTSLHALSLDQLVANRVELAQKMRRKDAVVSCLIWLWLIR